ncbi:putative conserved secreted protein [Rosellinia necatrix]|uniref:Putative conserved secreted protein n=1 Tax=Rosellinia necatrix TaxID=77044 RepID=A0A1W2TVR8_ROSNE|nr:putative conserved secreted protein [Rosellinia necatrix]
MLTQALIASLGVAAVLGTPLERRDDTQPVGTNPIKATTQFLGKQTSSNSCSHRDLGFTGQLAGQWYGLYGDTLWCNGGVTNPDQDPEGFHGIVRDAITRMGSDPLKYEDLHLNGDSPVRHPLQFVPFNAAWGENQSYGFGGTSIVETGNGVGAVYYLVNTDKNVLIGAGIAKIEIVNNEPTVTQRLGNNGWWWDSTKVARYGDQATFKDPKSDYIYTWGGPPTYITDYAGSQYAYMARVHAADAFDLSKYEYFWGRSQGWKRDVLTTFSTDTAVMWGAGQGQFVWSDFYQVYIYVHIGGNKVLLRTATSIEGPWTPDVAVYEDKPINNGFVYAGVAHPYLDTSGRTLVISWTNANTNPVVKVTFSK